MITDLTHQKQIASLIGPDMKRLLLEVSDPETARDLVDEFHPEDIADLLSEMEMEDAAEILRTLPDDVAAPIFERLNQQTQSVIIALLGPDEIANIASEMASDNRTDMIEALPEQFGEQVLEKLKHVDPDAAAEIEHLSQYRPETVGAVMTTEFISTTAQKTVAETIEKIRKEARETETIYTVFVLDADRELHGVVSLRDLILAEPGEKVSEIAKQIHSVSPHTDQEEAARILAKYDLIALPVVNETGAMVGVVTADDMMDVLTQEGTEDVHKMGGMETIEDPYFATSFWTFIRKRGLWLVVLFVEEFFTGSALRHYDTVLESVTKLAFYVPLLISTGGNSGSQSATLVIRGMALGEIKLSDWWKILWREVRMGLVLGTFLAVVGVGRVMMWRDGILFALVVALTLIAIVTMGCVVGSLLPLLMKRLRIDPATSSTPFIASLVDVLGIIIYFNIAMLILHAEIAVAQAHPHLHP